MAYKPAGAWIIPQAQILIRPIGRACKFHPLNLLQLSSNGWLDQLQIIANCQRKTFEQRPIGIFPGIGGEVKFERGDLGIGRRQQREIELLHSLFQCIVIGSFAVMRQTRMQFGKRKGVHLLDH